MSSHMNLKKKYNFCCEKNISRVELLWITLLTRFFLSAKLMQTNLDFSDELQQIFNSNIEPAPQLKICVVYIFFNYKLLFFM